MKDDNKELTLEKLIGYNEKINQSIFQTIKFEDEKLEHYFLEDNYAAEKIQNLISNLMIIAGYITSILYIYLAFYDSIFLKSCLVCLLMSLLILVFSTYCKNKKLKFYLDHVLILISFINLNFKLYYIILNYTNENDDYYGEILRIVIYSFLSTFLFLLIKLESNIFIYIFYSICNFINIAFCQKYSNKNHFYYLEGILSILLASFFYIIRKSWDLRLRLLFAEKHRFEMFYLYTNEFINGLNGYHVNIQNRSILNADKKVDNFIKKIYNIKENSELQNKKTEIIFEDQNMKNNDYINKSLVGNNPLNNENKIADINKIVFKNDICKNYAINTDNVFKNHDSFNSFSIINDFNKLKESQYLINKLNKDDNKNPINKFSSTSIEKKLEDIKTRKDIINLKNNETECNRKNNINTSSLDSWTKKSKTYKTNDTLLFKIKSLFSNFLRKKENKKEAESEVVEVSKESHLIEQNERTKSFLLNLYKLDFDKFEPQKPIKNYNQDVIKSIEKFNSISIKNIYGGKDLNPREPNLNIAGNNIQNDFYSIPAQISFDKKKISLYDEMIRNNLHEDEQIQEEKEKSQENLDLEKKEMFQRKVTKIFKFRNYDDDKNVINEHYTFNNLGFYYFENSGQMLNKDNKSHELKDNNNFLERIYLNVFYRKIKFKFNDKIIEDFIFYDVSDLINSKFLLIQENSKKEKIFAKLAHEFKTPINSIISITNNILEVKNSNFHKENTFHLNLLKNLSNYLIFLISDIIQFSNYENMEKVKIQKEKINLRDVLEFCYDILKSLLHCSKIKSEKIKTLLSIDHDITKSVVFSDAVKLKQILLNFISNSVKFTNQGKIEIQCSKVPYKEKIKISIVDTGMGIKDEDQKNLFRDFNVINNGYKYNMHGSGLGLSITLSFCKMMDISLEFESKHLKGTSVSLLLNCKTKFNSNENLKKFTEPYISQKFDRNFTKFPRSKNKKLSQQQLESNYSLNHQLVIPKTTVIIHIHIK